VSHVYVMQEDSGTKQLERIACGDEDKELQLLLERNLNLLPGDQISPGQDLRWLLIKREMPVVNPSTGDPWWSVDFLVVDQYGIPTIVECKRRNDTRSRREVVGQMLEYAASGRHYWTASDFRSHAQNAAGDEAKLSTKLKELTGSDTDPEDFFSSVEKNLQRSKMRLIFFLEDSPLELRSIVEFLNGQLKDMEVLIVEARQYQQGGSRIVVPWVFGFTEEARVAKRESRAETIRTSVVKGEAAFWEFIDDAPSTEGWRDRLRDFIAGAVAIPGCEVTWQRSCLVSVPDVVPQKILFAVRRDGYLELYLARWQSLDVGITEEQIAARDEFFKGLESTFGMKPTELQASQYPQLAPKKWLPKADEFQALIKRISSFSSADVR
jgi:hypothetical protein